MNTWEKFNDRYESLCLLETESEGLVEIMEMLEQENNYTNMKTLYVIKASIEHIRAELSKTHVIFDEIISEHYQKEK